MSGRLNELLAAIDRSSALVFVDEQIGPLLAYDTEHGSDLTEQLERALDDLAGRPLDPPATPPPAPLSPGVRRALELLGADLDRPSDRLALHLALKLHRLHAGERGGPRRGVASS
jgi:hypothetical protein